jgi:hypothetical protein
MSMSKLEKVSDLKETSEEQSLSTQEGLTPKGAGLIQGYAQDDKSNIDVPDLTHERINSAQKGSDFERQVGDGIFEGEGKRLVLLPEDNPHVDQIGDGVGISKNRRIFDVYWKEDQAIWELKSGYENSIIDRDQLEEYSLMEQAGYIYARENGKKTEYPVKSVNYLFETKKGAETNKPYLDGYATTWYLNDKKEIVYLDDE